MMARTENDTWDLASSVGATATMVAAARAIATKADDALIDDPFAEPLVRAVGVDFFTKLASGELRAEDVDVDHASVGMARMTDNMAVRTKFFDEFLLPPSEAAIQQTPPPRGPPGGDPGVGPGLPGIPAGVARGDDRLRDRSARGHRVQDQDARGLRRRADCRPPDRRGGSSLRLALGTDRRRVRPEQAHRVERRGPVGYLPPEAQDKLLDTITELSAVGSRVAVESTPGIDPADHEKAIERMQEAAQQWRNHGFELDFADLIYLGDRNEASAYLADRGWQVSWQSVKQLLSENGLPEITEEDEDVARFGDLQYVTGILGS